MCCCRAAILLESQRHGGMAPMAGVLQCKKEYGSLVCLRPSIASKSREGMLPLSSSLVRGALHPVLGSSVQHRHGHTGESPAKDHKVDEGTGASHMRKG